MRDKCGGGNSRSAAQPPGSAGDSRACERAIHRLAESGHSANCGGDSVSDYDNLISAARLARENAHAPYSNFRVGAALCATSGRIFGGFNVDNATYVLTVCAARVPIFQALSEGQP